MADGDIGIWRDTNGTHDIGNSTQDVWEGVPFNSQVTAAGIYTQNANDIDVDLGEAGHYLVIYNIRATSGATNRFVMHARATLGGTEVKGSFSKAYARNSANQEIDLSGMFIVDATSGQDIRIETSRIGTNNYATPLTANACSLQIIKLADDWDYFRAGRNTNQSIASETFANVEWNDQLEYDTGSFTHSETVNPDEIELEVTGHYLVTVSVPYDQVGGERHALEGRLTLNGSAIQNVYTQCYSRYDNGDVHPILVVGAIIEATANDILRFQHRVESEPGTPDTFNTVENRMAINVVALPDGDYLRVYGTVATNPSVGTTDALFNLIDSKPEEDTASFSASTSTDRITINTDGDYLFFFAGTGLRSSTSGTRSMPQLTWYKNGSNANLGGLGWFCRGAQSAEDTFLGGKSGGYIAHGLVDTDIIDIRGKEGGDGGSDQDRLNANQYGITAVRISGLFVSEQTANFSRQVTRTVEVSANFSRQVTRVIQQTGNFSRSVTRTPEFTNNFSRQVTRTVQLEDNFSRPVTRIVEQTAFFSRQVRRIIQVSDNFSRQVTRTAQLESFFSRPVTRIVQQESEFSRQVTRTIEQTDNFSRQVTRTVQLEANFSRQVRRTVLLSGFFSRQVTREVLAPAYFSRSVTRTIQVSDEFSRSVTRIAQLEDYFSRQVTRTVQQTSNFSREVTRIVEQVNSFSRPITRTVEYEAFFSRSVTRSAQYTANFSRQVTRIVEQTTNFSRQITRTIEKTDNFSRSVARAVELSLIFSRPVTRTVEQQTFFSRSITRIVRYTAFFSRALTRSAQYTNSFSRQLTRTVEQQSDFSRQVSRTAQKTDYFSRSITRTPGFHSFYSRQVTRTVKQITFFSRQVTRTVQTPFIIDRFSRQVTRTVLQISSFSRSVSRAIQQTNSFSRQITRTVPTRAQFSRSVTRTVERTNYFSRGTGRVVQVPGFFSRSVTRTPQFLGYYSRTLTRIVEQVDPFSRTVSRTVQQLESFSRSVTRTVQHSDSFSRQVTRTIQVSNLFSRIVTRIAQQEGFFSISVARTVQQTTQFSRTIKRTIQVSGIFSRPVSRDVILAAVFSRSVTRFVDAPFVPINLLEETRSNIQTFWDSGNVGFTPSVLEADNIVKIPLRDITYNYIVVNFDEEVSTYPTMGARHVDMDHLLFIHCFSRSKARARAMIKEIERIFNNQKDKAAADFSINTVWFLNYKKQNNVLGYHHFTATLKYESVSRTLIARRHMS